jgi:leucyl aminopeptidase
MQASLPDSSRPRVLAPKRSLTGPACAGLDALLVFVTEDDARGALAGLPQGRLLARLFRGKPPKAGQVADTRLSNPRQTFVSVGVVARAATPFQLLELAGKMMRPAAAAEPEFLGVATAGLAADPARAAVEAGLAAALAADFALPSFRSRRTRRRRLAELRPFAPGSLDVERVAALAEANDLARWLTAMPPNLLTPGRYRRLAEKLALREGWRTRFYDQRGLRRLGAGAFLAVVAGSPTRDAGILHVQYRPRGGRGAPVALVGKGLCFDTGGTNLKTHKSMLDMHTDMAGSAVALATLVALQRIGYPRPVDAWLALAENHIGAAAYKPQDVVTACNGTTIQVIHTDAEGRMALADTLALASRTRPAAIIDLATLTGACVNALTERYSGAFTNRPTWRDLLERAGRASGERIWCFPLDDDFDTELESKVADVVQCPVDGKGDHIYAARFLQRFVRDGLPWVHLDLSSATRTGGLAHVPTDITGFGVRLLLALLHDAAFQDAAR